MGKIALLGMDFHAHHGYYEEERITGNLFTVDVIIKTNFSKAAAQDTLTDTINYEEVYALIKIEMSQPSALLEHVAERIVSGLLNRFSAAQWVKIRVAKHHPPIGGDCRVARIEIKRKQA
jgi:7,8-dihydroneopterin aldolase/epimerase/oxygenase